MLFEYQKQVQRFLRDQKQVLINPDDLLSVINRARREVAMRTSCCRVLTPISGQIIGATVTAGGTGYTSPTVIISGPDFPSGMPPFPNGAQATATATTINGVITAINIVFGGYGYFQPTITITDPTGTGATATPTMSFISQLNGGQELYNFSDINLSAFPGLSAVFAVRSLSVIYANYRYSLAVISFSRYQAMYRYVAQTYQYTPVVAAQFGRGTSGSLLVYPLQNQAYQFEVDCMCLPSDLADDQSVEAIPQPWQDAVPFLATSYAFNELQNLNTARYYRDEFDRQLGIQGRAALPGRAINIGGRSF